VKQFGVRKRELGPNASGGDRGERQPAHVRKLSPRGYNPIVAVGFSYAAS
jgi:hypothetical protein